MPVASVDVVFDLHAEAWCRDARQPPRDLWVCLQRTATGQPGAVD
jgi:hypothetical protein